MALTISLKYCSRTSSNTTEGHVSSPEVVSNRVPAESWDKPLAEMWQLRDVGAHVVRGDLAGEEGAHGIRALGRQLGFRVHEALRTLCVERSEVRVLRDVHELEPLLLQPELVALGHPGRDV